MRVIHVAYEAERYGIGTFLRNLISHQKNSFEDLYLAVAFHADGPCMQQYRALQIEVHSLGHNSAKDIRSFFHFYNIFRHYDIVHLHSCSPWAFLGAKLAGKRVIYTFHGTLGLNRGLFDIVTKAFHYFVLSRHCDFFTFASTSSFSRYINSFKGIKLKAEKYEIIPYGILIDDAKAKKSKSTVRSLFGWNKKFLIGTAARINPLKRLERLIEAFNGISLTNDYVLVILGSGDEIYGEYLKNLIHKYNLHNNVQFLGYRTDIYDILNVLDVFVLPSANEPFGLALVEAMTLGVPSIAFDDGGGTVDILGQSGVIVSSTEGLRDMIEKLQKDSDLRTNISKSVKERAKRFDISFTAQEISRIYRNLIAEADH